ncbi:MAG: hypothetical protein ACOH2N_00120 [Devosia sp.]
MAAFNKFNAFVEALAEKVHNLGSDQIVVALCTAANAPVVGNSVLGDLTQISYTNCSSRNVTTDTSEQTGGTYKLVLDDLTLTAGGGAIAAFRYIVLYNDTAASDNLIGFYDYGSDLTLADGESLTIDFDGSNGVLTLA